MTAAGRRKPAARESGQASPTRQHLLRSAAAVFSDKGYKGASVRMICSQADMNLASVNYYFGTKENLYFETFQYVFSDSSRRQPKWGEIVVPEMADLEQWRAFARPHFICVLGNCMSRDKLSVWRRRMIALELTRPTPCIKKLMEEYHQPLHDFFCRLLAAAMPASRRDAAPRWSQIILMSLSSPSHLIPPMDELLLYQGESQEVWVARTADFLLELLTARLRERAREAREEAATPPPAVPEVPLP